MKVTVHQPITDKLDVLAVRPSANKQRALCLKARSKGGVVMDDVINPPEVLEKPYVTYAFPAQTDWTCNQSAAMKILL